MSDFSSFNCFSGKDYSGRDYFVVDYKYSDVDESVDKYSAEVSKFGLRLEDVRVKEFKKFSKSCGGYCKSYYEFYSEWECLQFRSFIQEKILLLTEKWWDVFRKNDGPLYLCSFYKYVKNPQSIMHSVFFDNYWYPLEWIEDVEKFRSFIYKGYEIYRKSIRGKLFVWGKCFQYLAKKGFKVKCITLNFTNMHNFFQFLAKEESLTNFLNRLQKNALYVAKKSGISKPKCYYLAFTEFQDRGVPHIHILLATNFYFYNEKLGENQYFNKTFPYGYIHVKNVDKISLTYMLKPQQKQPFYYAMLRELLYKKLGAQKVHFVYVSNTLKKDFATQHKKIKDLHSFAILYNFGIYATDISKPEPYTTIFKMPNNLSIYLKTNYNFAETLTYSKGEIKPKKIPVFSNAILQITDNKTKKTTEKFYIYSFKKLIQVLKTIKETIFNYNKNKKSKNENLLNSIYQKLQLKLPLTKKPKFQIYNSTVNISAPELITKTSQETLNKPIPNIPQTDDTQYLLKNFKGKDYHFNKKWFFEDIFEKLYDKHFIYLLKEDLKLRLSNLKVIYPDLFFYLKFAKLRE